MQATSAVEPAEAAKSGGRAGGSAGFSRARTESRSAPAPTRQAPCVPIFKRISDRESDQRHVGVWYILQRGSSGAYELEPAVRSPWSSHVMTCHAFMCRVALGMLDGFPGNSVHKLAYEPSFAVGCHYSHFAVILIRRIQGDGVCCCPPVSCFLCLRSGLS